ncbi:MAG: DUF983 domain-containing protein [Saprospiraceae bacterium]
MNFITSLWKYKCPKCRQGDLFVKPFDISNPLNINEKCEHCSQLFEPEPGYYFGAMFVSYVWTAFSSLAIIGFCMMVLNLSVNVSFGILVLISALTFFWIARISRSIYIHLDVRYDKVIDKTT